MSVWGRINRDEVAQEQDDTSNTEEQCTICYNGAQSVRFKPCNHAACKNCVDDLRRTNIFKVCVQSSLPALPADHTDLQVLTALAYAQADAGVKCPYCRTYVENYEPLERYCSKQMEQLYSKE